ncbi:hypothetical protein ABT024_10815 [Streptomyces sp. NPDC002812]|uniref:hypothetical protein n=1 Tax=unclassified Streptomyces TaxID=2593676 RepID=UPI002030C850|nr:MULTISPECIES: hypothetical protein [unclassified Streptomyces]MCM1969196.1 hypothetical protein [Streptomyces sp. G1]MCX5122791.1 hypothetical protein [Streptomyces sp. NBC_00347]MCX5296148.1 hypothetical protein [Streptomyces sp. NBC_00193]
MNRTRTAVIVLAAAAAALAPALSGAATAADSPYLQDPSGGDKTMKSMWTKDDMHKVEAQFRFHPSIQYKTITRPGPKGAEEYERKVGDPKTLAWEPGYEFAWSVADSQGVKKVLTTKDGKQALVLHAVLRDGRRAEVARVHQELRNRPATGRTKVPGGKRIKCDTGTYTVEWSVTRTGYGTLTGSLPWDSSCEQYRTAFTPKNQGAS